MRREKKEKMAKHNVAEVEGWKGGYDLLLAFAMPGCILF
jgi:hypothetical protein